MSKLTDLVDQAVELNAEIKSLTDKLNQVKSKIAKRGEGMYVGTTGVSISVSKRTQIKFSTAIAKSLLTPADLKQCFYTANSTVIRFVVD